MINFCDLALIIKADSISIPDGLTEENLFQHLREDILELLLTEPDITHFGYAPDNTADNQDELLYDGTQIRIICNEKYLGIDLGSSNVEVFNAFYDLIKNYVPMWTTIIEERGFLNKETTIDLFYRDVF
jgi:hypothetical protein